MHLSIKKIYRKSCIFSFFLFYFFQTTSFSATKNILLLDLDGNGGPDILLHKSDDSFEWFKNDQYSYYNNWYGTYSTYGNINPGIRFLTNEVLSFLDQSFANALITNLQYNNAFDSIQYDSNFQPLLSRANLDRLTWLWSYDNNITSVEGIEELRNLENLQLEDSSISNLSPIWDLKSLNILNISWGGKVTSIDGIASLADLEYLNLAGQRIKDISELTTLNNLRLVELEENFIDLSDPSTQSVINQLRQNGVIVDVDGQVPLSVQQLSSQMDTHLSQINTTDDPKANFVYGFELLLELLESTESSSLKSVAINGGAAQSLLEFTLPDLWRNDLGYEDNSELNSFADLDQLEDYFYDVFIPRLTTINSHFAKMSAHNQTISLEQDITGNEDLVIVDKGDAFALMAIVEALKGLLQALSSYNWDYNLQELETLENDDLINLEAMLDGSSEFGKLKSQNQLSKSKQSFKNAVQYYKSASDHMRTRLDQEFLFEMSSSDLNEDNELRSDLDEFLSALDSTHNLSEETSNTEDIINLSAFFDSKFDPVELIPPVVGDKFESDEFTDPTFGGLMPNWTMSILKQKLLDEGLIADDALEGSTEVEGAPNWNQSNWLGYFFIPFKPDPNKFWMFHQKLNWVYFESEGPSNIWLFFSETGDWLWTKKSVYPYLFSDQNQNWLYLMPNGSLLLWQGSDWGSL